MTATVSRTTLDDVLERPTGVVRLIDRLTRGRSTRRGVLVGAAVAGSALVTDPKAYALRPMSAYATICGPANTAASGWTVFCATINKGVNACPPGSFTAGWWKAADSSWCGGGYRYIVDCNAQCTRCTSGCADHMCDSKCWNCSCGSGSKATCDQRRVCCNDFRYGQCNTQVKCSGGVHCRVVSCVPPYKWDNCSTTSLRSDATAEHSSPYLPQWSYLERLYIAMGAQRSYLKASTGPIRAVGDGLGLYVTYQGGRIWWTRARGAVALTTYANNIYLTNGGPSRFGYPIRAIQVTAESGWIAAMEKGCVVASSATGAQVVWGIRWTLWQQDGRETGHLKYPVAPLEYLPNGAWIQRFQGGCIVDSAQTTSQVVWGTRWTRWVAQGRESGPLGFPVAPLEYLPATSWIQRFQNGCYVDSGTTGVAEVRERTWTAWQQVGREKGTLGYPTAAMESIAGGTRQAFQGGGIWGRSGQPAWAVTGAVLAAWEAAGGTGGAYGFPTAHVRANANGTATGTFEGGSITA